MSESRDEDILQSIIDGKEYNAEAQSRIEALLIELKEKLSNTGGSGGSGALKKTLLWENASPSSNFASQTLQLNLTEYDYLSVIVRTTTTISTQQESIFENKQGEASVSTQTNGGTYYVRNLTIGSNGLTFSKGMATGSATAANSARCIPTAIYGIKGKIK